MYNTNQTMNMVNLIGRLGQEPIITFTKTKGTPVMRLSLATQAKMPDNNGGWKVDTQWHRVVVFGRDALFFGQRLHKGMLVNVTGSIVHQERTDEAGQNFRWVDIYVERIQCLRH